MGTEGRGRDEELGVVRENGDMVTEQMDEAGVKNLDVVRENEELEKRMLCERTMGRKGLKKLGVV